MEGESKTSTSPEFTVGSNNIKVCSLFNAKEYSSIVNQDNVKVSKLMKLNISNAQPIILQDYAGYVRDFVGGNLSRASVDLLPPGSVLKNETSDVQSSLLSPVLSSSVSNIPDIKFCSFCNTGFCNQLEQRQHYKLDWHRYNIKLNIKQKQSVSEQQFTQLMTKSNDIDNDDVSSISGSESDDSSDSDTDSSSQKLPISQKQISIDNANMISSSNKIRVIFENDKGNIIALYKCLFITGNKADESELLTEAQYINIFNKMPKTIPNTKSLVVMLGGGHFAAAVFKGSEPVLHKTFHSYTVRAKQGGSQSTKDNKRATGAKSAGASLRRYNEQSLLQHVQDILSTWSIEIAECKYIFYRAVGPANRSILFGGKQSPLDKNDPRLCKIPFPTRRATFSEVKRVHSLLMSLYIYESEEIFSNIFQLNVNSKKSGDRLLSSPVKKKKDKDDGNSNKTNRASKLRQSPTRDDNDKEITDIVDRLKLESSSSSDNEDTLNNKNLYSNSVNDVSISFDESLLEYDNSPVPKSKKQSKIKKSNNVINKDKDNLNGCDKEQIKDEVEDNPDDDNSNENKLKKKKRKKKSDKPQIISDAVKDPLVNKLSKKIYLSCFNGDIDSLKAALEDYRSFRKDPELSTDINDENKCDNDPIVHVFNQTTQDGLTLLQNAAKNSQKEIVRFLLENGSDPCAKDKKSMTAYDFAPDKDTRNVFRRFMGEFPDKYDYSKSHIPSPLTDSIEKEMAEKKRALKKAKRQKEKEKWIADEPKRQEEAEKKRFLQLSDREKRALAAERRILASVGKAANNLALTRCYQCAINITGKVPFEYDSKLFCSMDCLKAHRLLAKKNQL